MKDLKIDLIDILHNEDEKQEAVWMLNKIGYKTGYKSVNFYRYLYACGSGDERYSKTIQFGNNAKTFRRSDFKEVKLQDLKKMAQSKANYKIKVNNEAESKEVQELLFELGFGWQREGKTVLCSDEILSKESGWLVLWKPPRFEKPIIQIGCGSEYAKEITLSELRAMVEPKMKEYLMPNRNYEYILTDAREGLEPHAKDWIEIPEWANYAYKNDAGICFLKGELGFNHPLLIWQRPTQPEALPFIDDNPQSLNEQYAEIEQVRQSLKDNVNHPSHYTQGKVECLDALESATIGKSGIEAVCVANIIKYLWRYEEKNGLEDIKKAQFYLNRLIATLENNNE